MGENSCVACEQGRCNLSLWHAFGNIKADLDQTLDALRSPNLEDDHGKKSNNDRQTIVSWAMGVMQMSDMFLGHKQEDMRHACANALETSWGAWLKRGRLEIHLRQESANHAVQHAASKGSVQRPVAQHGA